MLSGDEEVLTFFVKLCRSDRLLPTILLTNERIEKEEKG